jgi:hypothetical protein
VRATGLSCVRARLVRIKTEEEKHKAAQGGVVTFVRAAMMFNPDWVARWRHFMLLEAPRRAASARESCVRARLVRIKTEEEKHKAAQGGVVRWWRVECARS